MAAARKPTGTVGQGADPGVRQAISALPASQGSPVPTRSCAHAAADARTLVRRHRHPVPETALESALAAKSHSTDTLPCSGLSDIPDFEDRSADVGFLLRKVSPPAPSTVARSHPDQTKRRIPGNRAQPARGTRTAAGYGRTVSAGPGLHVRFIHVPVRPDDVTGTDAPDGIGPGRTACIHIPPVPHICAGRGRGCGAQSPEARIAFSRSTALECSSRSWAVTGVIATARSRRSSAFSRCSSSSISSRLSAYW